MRHEPRLPQPTLDWASQALRKIATTKNFQQIVALLKEAPPGPHFLWLIEYLGKVETPEARELAISYIDGFHTEFAIKALVQMKATGVRHLIEPIADDVTSHFCRRARWALDRIPRLTLRHNGSHRTPVGPDTVLRQRRASVDAGISWSVSKIPTAATVFRGSLPDVPRPIRRMCGRGGR
ncbi:hypothetical protein NRB20_16500 [Nocardia sp. RB20]|uniref:Uncharacterized protein n=1 Tax=Nocardia macrotermitis TaxID=2585198 RepID=A0A7K0CYP3_9NOCA|nr:hypothetical protein [Nocardia macrotermitis]